MKIRKLALSALIALASVGCQTSAGFDPIEVDLSRKPAAAVPAVATPPPAGPREQLPPVPVSTPREPPDAAPEVTRPAAGPMPGSIVGESPEALVQSRSEAYNRHDLDALIRIFSIDAKVFDPPDRLRDSGHSQIRQTYSRRFAEAADARLEVRDVVREGAYVVSRETESSSSGASSTALVITEVRHGRIVRVWILR